MSDFNLERAAWYIQQEIESRKAKPPYCVRCGIPHPADWECKRNKERTEPNPGDLVGTVLRDGTLTVNRWRTMQNQHIKEGDRLIETIAQACQLIDRLLGKED